jgi:hypothetical protein
MMDEQKILKATHSGKLNLGEKELTCAVLEDGSRIYQEAQFLEHLEEQKEGEKKGKFELLTCQNYLALLMPIT